LVPFEIEAEAGVTAMLTRETPTTPPPSELPLLLALPVTTPPSDPLEPLELLEVAEVPPNAMELLFGARLPKAPLGSTLVASFPWLPLEVTRPQPATRVATINGATILEKWANVKRVNTIPPTFHLGDELLRKIDLSQPPNSVSNSILPDAIPRIARGSSWLAASD
jgi:hypothetical protein